MIKPIRELILENQVCRICQGKNNLDWDKPLDVKGPVSTDQIGKISVQVLLCERCRLSNEINAISQVGVNG